MKSDHVDFLIYRRSDGLIAAVLVGTFIFLSFLWKGCSILRQYRKRNKTAIKGKNFKKDTNAIKKLLSDLRKLITSISSD